LHLHIIAMKTRAEARMVPVGQRTGRRVRRKIGAQPLLLRRPSLAAADITAVAVDHDEMPGAEIVAVVAFGRVAGRRAKVREVAGRARGMILVMAGGWMGAAFVSPPGGVITVVVLIERAVGVGVIPRREDRARDRVK